MNYEEEKNIQEQPVPSAQNNSQENYEKPTGNYSKEYRTGNRPQRPRIHTSQRAYSSESGREGGFRPEGFGAGLQGAEGPQRPYQRPFPGNTSNYQPRPRYNQGEGNYQPRPRYNQGEGGYQPRPRYNQGEDNYQPRPRYNQPEGGYQPRPRYNQGEGGYQPRPRYNQPEGGYQPRPRYTQGEGGYQPRPRYNQSEGYQPRPRYNQGEGGYQPRQQGGYQSRYNNGQRPAPKPKYTLKKRIEYNEEHIDPTVPLRLNKYLANAGVCSRREADEYITSGQVKVNGEVVKELGTKVLRTDVVTFGDRPVTLEKKVYVLLNKPKDYVTTSDDPQQRKTVMDLVKDACPERIYPVGRLDRNTTGVLLLTNDGDLASKLTHPSFLKKKVYHVFLDKNVTAHDMQQIAEGIELEDGEIHADAIEYPDEKDKSQVGIEIHSGKNRIVRRIFEHLGYRVVKLDRVQFAGLTKKNIRRGDWRFLTEKEVEILRMGAFE